MERVKESSQHRPIIAIDVDDVLAHSVEAFRIEVNQKTGAALTPAHFKVQGEYHHYLNRVLESNGIDHAAIKDDLFKSMVNDQSHIPPQPGAIKALRKLQDGYELVVITARPPEWEPQTHIWLERHYPGAFKAVHFAGNRNDPAKKTKGDMCIQVGASYLIDDNPEHARSAADKGVAVVLFGDYGWHVAVPEDMVRCKTWKDIEKFFDAERTRQ